MYRSMMMAVAAVLLLSACASEQPLPANAIQGAALPAADPIVTEAPKELTIAVNDSLKIEVDEDASLSRDALVGPTGSINMRLIGEVKVTGLTPTQLAADLQRRYEKYLKEPHVAVMVRTRVSNDAFTIDGAVNQPGVYPIAGQMSLIRAVAMAKGTGDLANLKQVVIFRTINKQRVAGVFDLNDVRSGRIADPQIYPDDTIVVAQSNTRRTLKDIVGVTPLVGLAAFLP